GGAYGYRKRPPAEIARMVESIEGSFVMFWDDDLLSDPRYTAALCRELKPLKKRWMSQMSATYAAHHPEMLRLLAQSGCSAMFRGLESITQASLTAVVYLQPTDNSLARKTGSIPPFDRHGKGMRWYATRFSLSSCSSRCSGWGCTFGDGNEATRRSPCLL